MGISFLRGILRGRRNEIHRRGAEDAEKDEDGRGRIEDGESAPHSGQRGRSSPVGSAVARRS
jgi:hypothetical protein